MDGTKDRRSLTEVDLKRMGLPARYWSVDCDGITDIANSRGVSPRDVTISYLRKIDDMYRRGLGILLWGSNGVGKTSIAAVIAKEFRRRYHTVLFMEAASLKSKVINKEHFDEDNTYWQRAMDVDVLVLDDLGKGVADSKDFGKNLIDELIRSRNANKKVTMITTNMVLKGSSNDLDSVFKKSTVHSLKEHVLAVHIAGADQREKIKRDNSVAMTE